MIKETGFGFLQYGIFVTIILSSLLTYNLIKGDKQLFLPGQTTHGHHQIELECKACHAKSFTAGEPMQNACMTCHGEPLEKARDKHPKKKFTDPRNADLLANLDATKCVTCHVEHSPEITSEHGVTLPQDFCFYCHQDIANERPSHEGFEFDGCGSSGCHSYHDNRALYERFLQKNIDKPSILSKRKRLKNNGFELWKSKNSDAVILGVDQHDGDSIAGFTADHPVMWADSVHAKSNVNCSTCHTSGDSERLGIDLSTEVCSDCHSRQSDGFKQGLHGMRLAVGLDPMTVQQSRLKMKPEAAHRELTCSSCHDPHQPDLKYAAVQACQGCHEDEHSQNYVGSKHAALFEDENSGVIQSGEGVSCATCHMPRTKKGKLVYAEHNQTLNLKPNSKMLRSVCMNCHGLEYSTSALADKSLIAKNFTGGFVDQHPSFDMVRTRMLEKQRLKKERSSRSK
ncbi:cytochrome c3 family protein [Arenicella sp. 4NH20-0111]